MASAPETSSPSPKRVKLTGAKRKTFLFLIARHSSWKATVSLPSMSAFSVGDVKNALKERSLPVPAFPKGKFEVIRADKAFQVAIFKYGRESVVGCRRTASKQHDALPCIIKAHKTLAEFIREPNNLRLGYHFLWGVEQPYQVNAGKVTLDVGVPDRSVEKASELQRAHVLAFGLRQHYGDNYTVSLSSGHNSSRFCPFTGGGDIEIVYNKCGTRAIVLLEREGQDEAEEEQQLQHTPPKAGEVRAALIEGKVSSPQAEEEVTKQLMAKLVLLGATRLHRLLLTATGEEVAEFNHFVVYGCQISPVHSLKLLKLAIDFDEEALTFYELFQLPVCCGLGAYIDMVLDYVFGALKIC